MHQKKRTRLLLVLMSILSKLLLSFMRGYLLSLPFLSAGHVNTLLIYKDR